MRLLLVLLVSVTLALPARSQARVFGEVHRMFPPDSATSVAVALGDVDGDLDVDVVFANPVDPEALYLNQGNGVFSDSPGSIPNVGFSEWVALGDVDGDTDLDALFASAFGARLFLNDGAGVFSDATGSLPGFSGVVQVVALEDLDGDGDLDALLANNSQDRLYLNDGTGVFIDATGNLPPDSLLPLGMDLGDVDGDGDVDILLGISSGLDRLYLNDGSAVFSDATANLPSISGSTNDVDLGDVDGDGDLDAFLARPMQDILYLNDGSGVFTDVTANLPVDLLPSRSAALGDVDGDDDLDVLVGKGVASRLLLNDGAGVFVEASPAFPAGAADTRAVALGDVDGDGDLDAVQANTFQNRLYLNNGAGAFTEAGTNLPFDLKNSESIAVADVDGDGDLDAFIGNGGDVTGEQNRLYLNDGTGVFEDATAAVPPILDRTRVVALGDVDGDADPDVLIGNKYPETDRLYRNDGVLGFTDVTSSGLPGVLDDVFDIVLEDVDGDGDRDAFFGNAISEGFVIPQQNRLFLNDGAGSFTEAVGFVPADSSHRTHAVALGDVDGDGDPDALIGNHKGHPDGLYLNVGGGVFSDATANLPGGDHYTEDVALGDVDGDGDLDALIGTATSPTFVLQNRLYRNEGAGIFSDASASLPPTEDISLVAVLGDLDLDGDQDAMFGAFENKLYINDGAGVFADASGDLPGHYDLTVAIALGDVDDDGDRDALIGNAEGDQNRLFTNLTRQLSWRGIPRIGKPLAIDLHGTPGATWYLAQSLGTAGIPYPPFGTLKLDPSKFFGGQNTGVFDPDGFASLALDGVSSPSLVGLSAYWQALIGFPLKASNLEVTTLTDL